MRADLAKYSCQKLPLSMSAVKFTSVRATGAAERIAQVAAPAAARRLRRSSRCSDESLLFSLGNLLRLASLRAVKEDDLALCELFRFKLSKPARAVLARLLPPRCPTHRGLACGRPLTVCSREQALGVDSRRRRRGERPQRLLRCLALWIGLATKGERRDSRSGFQGNGGAR